LRALGLIDARIERGRLLRHLAIAGVRERARGGRSHGERIEYGARRFLQTSERREKAARFGRCARLHVLAYRAVDIAAAFELAAAPDEALVLFFFAHSASARAISDRIASTSLACESASSLVMRFSLTSFMSDCSRLHIPRELCSPLRRYASI
jgi:hypothetical protein